MTAQQLPLDQTAMLPLRQAYEQTPSIRNRYTFAQVTSGKPEYRGLFLSLRLHAEALARATRSRA